MKEMQRQMFREMRSKSIFADAQKFAYDYADGIDAMRVFPSRESIENLKAFDEPCPTEPTEAKHVLAHLNKYGGPATVAQTGGRYFGFVNGGVVPASLAVKWLSDFWDQNGGLSLTSPLNAKLEEICERWLKELFGLPPATVAGFVSGTSMANLSALAAARFRLFKNQGWDINQQGLNGSPKIRIIAHDQVHASIKKTLALLGFGLVNVDWLASDEHGRLMIDQIPVLDNTCLVLLQAGNVNSGAFDPFDAVCDRAQAAGAWVHIDGAFGLWAQACASLKHLTIGIEKANSWAVDGHKTLNTPYDCGIVMCNDSEALITAMQASGDYLQLSDRREPILYGPEMSKRSRAIELWGTIKYLGSSGIDEMITGFHHHAVRLSVALQKSGFILLNEVVFNQVLVSCADDQMTNRVLALIQESGECWVGGTMLRGKSAIRISICSWATTEEDIDRTVRAFVEAKRGS